MTSNHSVGFIGTGVMGKSMIRNLLHAGYSVCIYTRTKEKALDLIEEGCIWKESPAEIAQSASCTITMVGYPQDVEEIYFGDNGLLLHSQPGAYLIDMTTSSPILAKKIAAAASAKGVHAIDAPVSGGDIGAKEGTLSIMAGAEKNDFEAVLPIFKILGKSIRLQGPAGAGQYAKMCNQIVIASTMVGVVESMVYAQKTGLNPANVLESIEKGAAGSWSLSNLAPRMIRGDYAPGFFVKHFIKDMKIAIESADEIGLDLPGLRLAKSLYEKLAAAGEQNSGTQALIKLYQM